MFLVCSVFTTLVWLCLPFVFGAERSPLLCLATLKSIWDILDLSLSGCAGLCFSLDLMNVFRGLLPNGLVDYGFIAGNDES